MAYYHHPSTGQIATQQQMYADATKRHFPLPQQSPQHHHAQVPVPDQQYYPDPQQRSHLQYPNQAHGQSPLHSVQQSHGIPPPHHPSQQQLHQHQQNHPSQFNAYNVEPASMPPPSTVGSMGMNAGTTMQPGMMQRPPSYQAHVRNNSQQQMSPSSPGYLQSPTSFSNSTPPGGVMAQSYYPQPTPSPTKPTPPTSAPVPQSQMSAGSPQATTSSIQKPHNTPPLKPVLQPPLSPEAARLEAQRVGALLDINRALIQEVIMLQEKGRTGAAPKPGADQQGQNSPTVAENASTDGKDAAGTEEKDGDTKDGDGDKKKQIPCREYMECMRRLQANLAYLAVLAERPFKRLDQIPERPVIMEALPPIQGNAIPEETLQDIKDLYKTLRDLYPLHPPGAQSQNQGQNMGASSLPQSALGQVQAQAMTQKPAGQVAG